MFLLIATIVAIVVAAAIGLASNYFSITKSADEGASVTQVLGAAGLIATFLLAIVLSGAASSYAAAGKAAKQEADTIDSLYESAAYVDQPYRQRIQAAAVCYAFATVGPEWETLATGKSSPVPSNWTGTKPTGLRAAFLEMTPKAQGFSLVQSLDTQRGNLRTERVAQANPSVPPAVIWFMVALISLSIGGLAYSIPRVKNTGQLVALAVVVFTFIGALALIWNLDRPFRGALAIAPTAMQTTADDAGADYVDDYGKQPPCDDEGNPDAEALVPVAAPTPPADSADTSATTTSITSPPAPTTTIRR